VGAVFLLWVRKMTGLDCLREEMEKRGLTKSQIESKTVAVVLDIIANSGHKYMEIWKNEAIESKKLNDLRHEVQGCKNEIENLKSLISKLNREEAEEEKHRIHCEDYIDEFNKSLMECESETGRDSMKAAQMFVNTVSVDTKYDNTAFIIGLASILSKGGMNPIGELKKINKKLPDIDNNFY
jgi:chromosome segregation ATPase